jgi:hypothetical protein
MTTEHTPQTRRTVLRGTGVALGALALGVGTTGSAAARKGKPSQDGAIYGSDAVWRTKFTTEIPGPNEHNRDSFDDLYFIVHDGGPVQLPLSEAAPGDTDYNGGRWISETSTVLKPMEYKENYKPITNAEDFHDAVHEGVLSEPTLGAPGGIRPDYFQCPLLRVRSV